MVDRLSQTLDLSRSLSRRFLKPWIWTVALVVGISFAVWYIAIHGHVFTDLTLEQQAVLVLLGPLFILQPLLVAFAWAELLTSSDKRIDRQAAMRVWLESQATKYIPGAFWPYAHRLGRMPVAGAHSEDTMRAIVAETFLILLVTGFTAAIFLTALEPTWGLSLLLALIVGTAMLALGGRLAWRASPLRKYAKLLWRDDASPSQHCKAFGLYQLAWILQSGLVGVMSAVLFSADARAVLEVAAAWPVAWMAGYVAIFLPAGIGAREGVLVALLQDVFSVTDILFLALLIRLVQAMAEFLALAAIWACGSVRVRFRSPGLPHVSD